MAYEKKFKRVYPNGWRNSPYKETPITAEVLNQYDKALENIENELVKIVNILDRFSQSNGRTLDASTLVSDLNDLDFNCAVNACSYEGQSNYVANCPNENAWFYVETIRFTQSHDYKKQIAHALTTEGMWVRTCVNGTWSAWTGK